MEGGWGCSDRCTYYEPLAEPLEDPELMHDLIAVKRLAGLKGGFLTPRAEIRLAEAIPKRKPGMAGIPHTGRIVVHVVSGGKREFVPPGTIDTTRIVQSILR
jgi:hypothetical protein